MRLLAFVVLDLFTDTQAGEGAKLLASKSLLNSNVPWYVYNVGSSAVLQLDRKDPWLSESLRGDSPSISWTG
ncbi:hypothetical protein K5549_007636 [Capra hircus]|nr:hypothetical protein K5549_007636 [Capra hircus]